MFIPEHLRTSTVVSLVQSVYESQDWSMASLIHDALGDAGALPHELAGFLHAWILAEPANNERRIEYAEAVRGVDPHRARFIELQLQIAGSLVKGSLMTRLEYERLLGEEQEFFAGIGMKHVLLQKWCYEIHPALSFRRGELQFAFCRFGRGFGKWLEASWAEWLALEPDIYWWPGAKEWINCPTCHGRTEIVTEHWNPQGARLVPSGEPASIGHVTVRRTTCITCRGRGISQDGGPRLCPDHAQPFEVIMLWDVPPFLDGSQVVPGLVPRGTTIYASRENVWNSFTCRDWPWLTFVLPGRPIGGYVRYKDGPQAGEIVFQHGIPVGVATGTGEVASRGDVPNIIFNNIHLRDD